MPAIVPSWSSGAATHQAAGLTSLSSDGLQAFQRMVADVNGDGKADIVIAVTTTSGLWQYTSLGNGDGTFQAAVSQRLSSLDFGTTGAWTVFLADANGDGRADTIAVYAAANGLWQYTALRNADGTYQTSSIGQMSSDGVQAYQRMVADVNGDGKADIVAVVTTTSGLWQYTALGNGDGTYQAATGQRLSTIDFGPTGTWTVFLEDVNGDGRADTIIRSIRCRASSSPTAATCRRSSRADDDDEAGERGDGRPGDRRREQWRERENEGGEQREIGEEGQEAFEARRVAAADPHALRFHHHRLGRRHRHRLELHLIEAHHTLPWFLTAGKRRSPCPTSAGDCRRCRKSRARSRG